MPETVAISPADLAAREAGKLVAVCLEEGRSFLLEAGAGAGKTTSLVEALKSLLDKHSDRLRYNNQQIACITYTNAATDVISSRIDGNKIVSISTIHKFCWSLIKGFQPTLRKELQELKAWQDRLAESGGVALQPVEYELGFRKITDEVISLHHDDVLALTAALLSSEKFQSILAGRFPYIFIDEYQDTNLEMMTAVKKNLFGRKNGPLIGLFGDHWQRIYDDTCGHVTDKALEEIGKKANFRSATSIVRVLNKMRPELPQAVKDETFVGSANVFHTNNWVGARRTGAGGGHWKGDLPAELAREYLHACIAQLTASGWDFAPKKTKVLILTHNSLAAEQGYAQLARVFPYNDLFIEKKDDHIAFFADKLEPACAAYNEHHYGQMFTLFGEGAPKLSSHSDKEKWSSAMDQLVALRETGSIGQVIDHIAGTGYPKLPGKVVHHESEARDWQDSDGVETPEIVTRIRKLRELPYSEVLALVAYLDGHTPFATKHSVKGDEFDNVLVVLGRGWNRYNFDQYLEQSIASDKLANDKRESFERNRNLFYVCCSRPISRLALLFTQEISVTSLQTLNTWFGKDHVHDVSTGTFPLT